MLFTVSVYTLCAKTSLNKINLHRNNTVFQSIYYDNEKKDILIYVLIKTWPISPRKIIIHNNGHSVFIAMTVSS